MNRAVYRNVVTALYGTLLCLLSLNGVLQGQDRAREIIAQSKCAGGVVVHLHGADTSLLQSMGQESPTLLGHLLVAQEADAQDARQKLVEAGVHGKISGGRWQSGTLPFVDNFVNLLIVEQEDAVSQDEVLRVLAPEGTIVVSKFHHMEERIAEENSFFGFLLRDRSRIFTSCFQSIPPATISSSRGSR